MSHCRTEGTEKSHMDKYKEIINDWTAPIVPHCYKWNGCLCLGSNTGAYTFLCCIWNAPHAFVPSIQVTL
jgi:hypothetical protein